MPTPTSQFVDVQDVREDVVILKDGSFRAIVEIGSINFGLKSLEEQSAIISRYEGFLNSLDFPVQILINSRKLNLEEYIGKIDKLTETLDNELLKIQAAEYSRFIRGLLEISSVMSKKFYIIIPFYLITQKSKKGFLSGISSMLNPKAEIKKITNEDFNECRNQLNQRVSIITDGLSSLGLTLKQLSGNELANIFYSLYNPEAKEKINIENK